jgi:hypothetical protein
VLPYWIEESLYCDVKYVGWLFGPMVWHVVGHFSDGVGVWDVAQAHDDIQSDWGEVFKVKEVNREYIQKDGIIIGKTNLKGDQGDHSIFNMAFDMNWNLLSKQKDAP